MTKQKEKLQQWEIDKDLILKDADLLDEDETGTTESKPVSPEIEAQIDKTVNEALGLVSVTIRYQADLIQSFKLFAKEDGIGYQPLMRQVLSRYANERKKR